MGYSKNDDQILSNVKAALQLTDQATPQYNALICIKDTVCNKKKTNTMDDIAKTLIDLTIQGTIYITLSTSSVAGVSAYIMMQFLRHWERVLTYCFPAI